MAPKLLVIYRIYVEEDSESFDVKKFSSALLNLVFIKDCKSEKSGGARPNKCSGRVENSNNILIYISVIFLLYLILIPIMSSSVHGYEIFRAGVEIYRCQSTYLFFKLCRI